MHIVSNSAVTKAYFQQLIELDQQFWPEGDPAHFPEWFQRQLYEPDYEGIFLAVDEETDEVEGYFNVLFPSEKAMEKYLNDGSFLDLDNRRFQKGNNLLYLNTANVKEKYRGTRMFRDLACAFASWLDEKEAQGYHVTTAYGEAVTPEGGRTASKGFGMEPMADVDEHGIGHYISRDGLKEYREKIRKSRTPPYEQLLIEDGACGKP